MELRDALQHHPDAPRTAREKTAFLLSHDITGGNQSSVAPELRCRIKSQQKKVSLSLRSRRLHIKKEATKSQTVMVWGG